MKTLSTLIFTFLFGLIHLFAQESGLPTVQPEAQVQVQESDLTIELQNGKISDADSQHIEVDFVMTNLSDTTIILAERWNSWGAYQWTFILKDAKGHEFKFGNPQSIWFANAFTTFEIPAKKSITFKCMLSYQNEGFQNDTHYLFSSSANLGQISFDSGRNGLVTTTTSGSWEYPVELEGRFSSPTIQRINLSEKEISTNWSGSRTTPALILEVGKPGRMKKAQGDWPWIALAIIVASIVSFLGGVAFARYRRNSVQKAQQ